MNIILTLLLSLPLDSSSFSPGARLPLSTNGVPSILVRPTGTVISSRRLSSSSPLMAKKRRRKNPVASDPAPTPTTESDELPDFFDEFAESVEDEPVQSSSSGVVAPSPRVKATPIKRGTGGLNAALAEEVGGNVDGLEGDAIMEAMRGKSVGGKWRPPQSIQETLSDRGLEKFMDFEKMIERDGGGDDVVELPNFEDVISGRKQRGAMQEGRVQDAATLIDTKVTGKKGKKAARNAERKAAAVQREKEIEDERSPFEDLNLVKVLENGAWAGIGLLVVWEVYINSPLFQRAGSLIPVVYD